MFRHRGEWEIIADCLRIIAKYESGILLHDVWMQAKVITFHMQINYSGILRKCDLILLKDGKATITSRGMKFLGLYETIEKLMRSGFQKTGATFA